MVPIATPLDEIGNSLEILNPLGEERGGGTMGTAKTRKIGM